MPNPKRLRGSAFLAKVLLASIACSTLLSSCSFLDSYSFGEEGEYGGPYSGVSYLFNEPNPIEEPGLGRIFFAPFVIADLALSFAFDTLFLPITYFHEESAEQNENEAVKDRSEEVVYIVYPR